MLVAATHLELQEVYITVDIQRSPTCWAGIKQIWLSTLLFCACIMIPQNKVLDYTCSYLKLVLRPNVLEIYLYAISAKAMFLFRRKGYVKEWYIHYESIISWNRRKNEVKYQNMRLVRWTPPNQCIIAYAQRSQVRMYFHALAIVVEVETIKMLVTSSTFCDKLCPIEMYCCCEIVFFSCANFHYLWLCHAHPCISF